MRPRPPSPATVSRPSPGDFPVGSLKSRAAARNLLDRRDRDRIAAIEGTTEWRGAYEMAVFMAELAARRTGAKLPSEEELRRSALKFFDQGIGSISDLFRALAEERKAGRIPPRPDPPSLPAAPGQPEQPPARRLHDARPAEVLIESPGVSSAGNVARDPFIELTHRIAYGNPTLEEKELYWQWAMAERLRRRG